MAKPRLTVHGQVSLDGRLTLGPDVLLLPWGPSADAAGRWRELAGSWEEASARLAETYQPDAWMEGSNSFLSSSAASEFGDGEETDPGLYDHFLPESVVKREGHRAWMAVPDSRGRVRWGIKESDGVYGLILVSRTTPARYLRFLREQPLPYLVAGEERVDLALALELMNEKLGVERVLCTSPGKLGGALLRAGLVDQVSIDFFPAVVGGFHTPTLFESPDLGPEEWPTRLELVSAERGGDGHVWLRYSRV
jgi:2,5-diamino-6-(ribosylamino)-4(3H)-pyrimidinone 5'-phosphate reductase